MSKFVILEITPDGIDAGAWAEVHDTTLRLLAASPLQLMGLDWGLVCGTMVPLYTRSIERHGDTPAKRHWCVAAERTTLRTAEPQTLYRDLAHYRRGVPPPFGPPAAHPTPRSGNGARSGGSTEILRLAAGDDPNPARRPVQVFGDDTRDEPFHLPLLAAAMVVESRFPLHALASGGFDRARALSAQHLAESALSTPIPLPVRAEASRLRRRLGGFLAGDALDRAFRRLCLDQAEGAERARAATLQTAVEPLDAVVPCAAWPSVDELSLERRDDVHALALGVRRLQRQVGDLHARAEARRSGSDRGSALFALGCGNASLSRRAIAAILAERGPTLTEDAWDWIAREEDLDVLDFLMTLAAVQSGSLDFFHLRRAMFENQALCRHAVNAAKDEALMAWVAEKLSAEPPWVRRGR